MTPCEISFLLHCHTAPDIHPRYDSPAIKNAADYFVKNNIIEGMAEGHYQTTSKGAALVGMLCTTPMPTQAWIDGNGEVIR